jgi:hypothetical protein
MDGVGDLFEEGVIFLEGWFFAVIKLFVSLELADYQGLFAFYA